MAKSVTNSDAIVSMGNCDDSIAEIDAMIPRLLKMKFLKLLIITPEKPDSNLPNKVITEVNNAYWTAVNFFETRLVRKVILIVPTAPAAMLSIATIKDKEKIFFSSEIATYAKNKLVAITRNAPTNSAFFMFNFLRIKVPK